MRRLALVAAGALALRLLYLAELHGTPFFALNVAELLTDLGRAHEALGYYEQAARLAPDAADIQYALAQAYARGERWSDAFSSLETALAAARASGQGAAARDIEDAIRNCRAQMTGRTP